MWHRPLSLQLRDLADRLIVEYAGAVSPDQVETAVRLADLALDGPNELSGNARLLVCESFARRALTDQLASYRTTTGAVGPTRSSTHLLTP